MLRLGVFALLAVTAHPVLAGEACRDNYTTSGNFLTGQTYKTWASFPSVSPEDAYAKAYAFTIDNGFTVTKADKSMGVITAAQSATYANGKTVPLNIIVRPEAGGARVNISYTTPGGTLSPEDAIQKHFCLTMAAVSEPGGVSMPASASAPAASGQRSMRGLASITDDQKAQIERALMANVSDARMKSMVQEASANIKGFVERISCINTYNGSSLNIYAAPGHQYQTHNFTAPMAVTRYHDKNSCLTVVRIQGWAAPARNALRFEVVYEAEDSGESTKTGHEIVKQPDGTWLFRS